MENFLSIEEFKKEREKYKKLILSGAVFIYPTDTIYGIGCSAFNKKAVDKIKKLKKRKEKPFSIVAPSKKWILENFYLKYKFKKVLKKLPGKYTLILKKRKNFNAAPPIGNGVSVGVRIPNNFIKNFARYCRVPIVTTSVNISGMPYLTDPKQLIQDKDFSDFNKVDFVIDCGFLNKKPSTLIDCTGEKIDYIKRA